MAELTITPRAVGHFLEGDILHAHNSVRIANCHLQSICHPRRAEATLVEEYLKRTSQFLFQRVADSVERTDLERGGSTIVIGSTPTIIDGIRQHIRVKEYIDYARRANKHPLFGEAGAERWYGGKKRFNELNQVWNVVEAATPLRRANFRRMRRTPDELKNFLVLSVDDFTEDLEAPLTNESDPENIIVVRHRKFGVDLTETLSRVPASREQVDDRNVVVDVRATQVPRADVVVVRTR